MLEQEHTAVLQIREMRAQLLALKKRLEDDEAAEPIRDAATAVDKKMTPIEGELIEPKATASEDMLNYPAKLNSKLAHLQAGVDAADAPPTQQQLDLAVELEKNLTGQIAKWKDVQDTELAALNDLIVKTNLPAVGVHPVSVKEPDAHE